MRIPADSRQVNTNPRDGRMIEVSCCDTVTCECGGSCDCDELESAACGCHS
jgi:hypothetical protein